MNSLKAGIRAVLRGGYCRVGKPLLRPVFRRLRDWALSPALPHLRAAVAAEVAAHLQAQAATTAEKLAHLQSQQAAIQGQVQQVLAGMAEHQKAMQETDRLVLAMLKSAQLAA